MNEYKEIKEKLLKAETDFKGLGARAEKYQKLFLLIYFTPSVAAVFILNSYFQRYFKLYLKIILFTLIVAGLAIHYILRYKFQKDKNTFRRFVDKCLDGIKSDFSDDKIFISETVNAAREIFSDRGVEFSRNEINNSRFFNLVFIYLGIEIE